MHVSCRGGEIERKTPKTGAETDRSVKDAFSHTCVRHSCMYSLFDTFLFAVHFKSLCKFSQGLLLWHIQYSPQRTHCALILVNFPLKHGRAQDTGHAQTNVRIHTCKHTLRTCSHITHSSNRTHAHTHTLTRTHARTQWQSHSNSNTYRQSSAVHRYYSIWTVYRNTCNQSHPLVRGAVSIVVGTQV